jgi:hypothetical protein
MTGTARPWRSDRYSARRRFRFLLLSMRVGLPFPDWTARGEYRLAEPWFLYPGWRLRAWQLFETPAPFRMRNIFGGDRILDRV